uniref:Uncharacterized protein n=1 Tax=Lotus japonicus TaxID=34305 RepID=I3SUP8_LOTJA|nr:unknown [Lotus japonicus]
MDMDNPLVSNNFSIIFFNAGALTKQSLSPKQDLPSSAALQSFGSNGTLPRNGTSISLHIFTAPPPLLSNTSVQAIKFSNSGAFSLMYSKVHSVTSFSSPLSVNF